MHPSQSARKSEYCHPFLWTAQTCGDRDARRTVVLKVATNARSMDSQFLKPLILGLFGVNLFPGLLTLGCNVKSLSFRFLTGNPICDVRPRSRGAGGFVNGVATVTSEVF